MFSIGPILLEMFFFLLKPQELYPVLQAVQPLYTLPGAIILGFIFDSGRFGLGITRMIPAPYLRFAVGFFLFCLTTVIIRAPDKLMSEAILFGTPMLVALSLAHSVQTLTLYKITAAGLLALTLFLSFVGTHQANAPFRCYWIDPFEHTMLHYDGKPCNGPLAYEMCVGEFEEDHDRQYVCEHVGMMGTQSVGGRIRFRGNLEDPNELSLACAIGFPFAVAFWQIKKTVLRFLIILVTFGLVGACVFYSQSRGGQLVFMIVLGTYFIRSFGWKIGAPIGGVLAVPMLVLASMGGRSADEAEESALERTECLQVGTELVKGSPLWGIGKGQFGEYHFLTAHNSYVLAAAETGFIGMSIWAFCIYLSVKTPIFALRALKDRTDPTAVETRAWAGALLASLLGLVVGSFFLSFCYHAIFWIYLGLAGALAGVVRKQLPEWRVPISKMEMGIITGVCITLITVIFIYARMKMH